MKHGRLTLRDKVKRNIIAYAAQKGMTMGDLAERLGQQQSALSYRLNHSKAIDFDFCENLSDVLGVDIPDLFKENIFIEKRA